MNLDEFTDFAKTAAADKWCALYDTVCTDNGFFIKDPRDFLTSAKTLLQHNFDCVVQRDIVQRVQDYVSRCWTHAHSPARVSKFCAFIVNSNNHDLKIQAHPLVVIALARGLVSERHEMMVSNWIDEYHNVIQNQMQNETLSQVVSGAHKSNSARKI